MAVAFVRGAYTAGGAAHAELVITPPNAGNLLIMAVSKNTVGEPTVTDNSGGGKWTINATKAIFNASASEIWVATKIANGAESEIKTTVGTPEGVCYLEVSGSTGEIDKIEATSNVLSAKKAATNAYTNTDANDFLVVFVGAGGASGALSAWKGTGPVLTNIATTTGRTWAGWLVPKEVISAKTFESEWTTEKVTGMIAVSVKPSLLPPNYLTPVNPPTFRTPRGLYKPFAQTGERTFTEVVKLFTASLEPKGLSSKALNIAKTLAAELKPSALATKAFAIVKTLTAKLRLSRSFGKETLGASFDNAFPPNYKVVCKYNSLSGEITALRLYVFAPAGATLPQKLKAVIYSDNAGSPENLLAEGQEVVYTPEAGKNKGFPGTEGWLTLPLNTPLTVTEGPIWIGWIEGASEKGFGVRYDSVAGARAYNEDTYSDGPTSKFNAEHAITTDSEEVSIYAVGPFKMNIFRSLVAKLSIYAGGERYSRLIKAHSPTSWWRLNETGGTTATDSVGTNNGTYATTGGTYVLNEPAIRTNPDLDAASVGLEGDGKAASKSAYITPGSNFEPKTEFTLETWIKLKALPAESAKIFDNANPNVGKYGWFFVVNSTGKLEGRVSSNPISPNLAGRITKNVVLAVGVTHHIALVYKGGVSPTLKIYVDGVEVATEESGEIGKAIAEEITYEGNPAPRIGATDGGFPAYSGVNAQLADLAVYPTALTEAQLKEHYETGTAPKASVGRNVLRSLAAQVSVIAKLGGIPITLILQAILKPTATLGRNVFRSLTASLEPKGIITKSFAFARTLVATLEPKGSFSRAFALTRTLVAKLEPKATLVKAFELVRTLKATLEPKAVVTKSFAFAKTLVATLEPKGVLTRTFAFTRTWTAKLEPTATLVKALAIAKTIKATLEPKAVKSFILTRTLTAKVEVKGAYTKVLAIAKTFKATLEPIGFFKLISEGLIKLAAKMEATGSLKKQFAFTRLFAAAVNAQASVSKSFQIARTFLATLEPRAQVTKAFALAKTLVATMKPSGFLKVITSGTIVVLKATLAAVASLKKSLTIKKVFAAILSPKGSLLRVLERIAYAFLIRKPKAPTLSLRTITIEGRSFTIYHVSDSEPDEYQLITKYPTT